MLPRRIYKRPHAFIDVCLININDTLSSWQNLNFSVDIHTYIHLSTKYVYSKTILLLLAYSICLWRELYTK